MPPSPPKFKNAADKAEELPTIMKGLADAHLGTANVLSAHVTRHKSVAISNQQQSSNTKETTTARSKSTPMKRLSRLFKGSFKLKEDVVILPPSESKSVYIESEQCIDAVILETNIATVLLGPLLQTEHIQLMNTTASPPNYYHSLANQLVDAFINNSIKRSASISEIMLLGPVLDESAYQSLLSCFIDEFEGAKLIDLDILQGLIQLVECASYGYLQDDDLVRIATVLFTQLSDIHIGCGNHVLYLTWALSRILDAMVAGNVKDLNRDRDHQHLLQLLASLKGSGNAYLKYQAAYAYQALQYVPDDKTPLQVIWRYIQGTAKIASAATSVFKIDPNGLLEVSGKAVSDGITTLREGSGTAIRALKKKSEYLARRSWYLALQGTAMFIRQGRLSNFNIFVTQTPCRNNVDFQWGICHQLGEIAVDSLWDIIIRQQAVNFLGELYQSNSNIVLYEDVKRWILTILVHITKLSDTSLQSHASSLLAQLKLHGLTELSGSHPLGTYLPQPTVFPLITQVLDIPLVEHDLHILRSKRIANYNQPIYIAPMAKPSLHAPEDTLFPLIDKVKEFLTSDCQVMLILGDAGAGKSTFNKRLEHELWKDYKTGGRIPLFINLPGLRQPE
ncbi:hypothetical protein FBU30_008776 [Linnemannia zychae]|nr:hypothetical protein FBU30_008776 [Linnemannia zychae]